MRCWWRIRTPGTAPCSSITSRSRDRHPHFSHQTRHSRRTERQEIQMSPTKDSNAGLLNWDVFVTPGIPIVTRDKPPDVGVTYVQAMAATLIYGVRDAVLVDAFMTVTQANA